MRQGVRLDVVGADQSAHVPGLQAYRNGGETTDVYSLPRTYRERQASELARLLPVGWWMPTTRARAAVGTERVLAISREINL